MKCADFVFLSILGHLFTPSSLEAGLSHCSCFSLAHYSVSIMASSRGTTWSTVLNTQTIGAPTSDLHQASSYFCWEWESTFTVISFCASWENPGKSLTRFLKGGCSLMFLEPTTLEKSWNGLVLPSLPGPYQPSPLPFSLFAALGPVLTTITGTISRHLRTIQNQGKPWFLSFFNDLDMDSVSCFYRAFSNS